MARSKDAKIYSLQDLGGAGVLALAYGRAAGDKGLHRACDSFEEKHIDRFMQILFVTRGSVRFDLGNRAVEVRDGECSVILPGQIHSAVTAPGSGGVFLGIDPAFIPREVYTGLNDYHSRALPLAGDPGKYQSLKKLLGILIALQRDEGSSLDLRFSLGRGIVDLLAVMLLSGGHPASLEQERTIAHKFLDLVEKQCEDEKSPAAYAAMLGITPAYLSRVVKETTGRSPGVWVRETLLIRAKRQLFFTSRPVKDIAASLGYVDAAYFCRVFAKDAGCSPSEFRKRFRK